MGAWEATVAAAEGVEEKSKGGEVKEDSRDGATVASKK